MHMPLLILALSALLGAGVIATTLVALWNTRDSARPATVRDSFATELVWAAIPCLMLLAAAIPAVVAIASAENQ